MYKFITVFFFSVVKNWYRAQVKRRGELDEMTLEMSRETLTVKTNLVFYNLWTQLEVFHLKGGNFEAIRAIPPGSSAAEWVLAMSLDQSLTMAQLESVFKAIKELQGERPLKIVMGILSDDSTVMYYNVHDGLVKPRQS